MRLVDFDTAARLLNNGEVGVVPTDTLYGIVGRALDPEVVERIYALRQRELTKAMIILVADWDDLKDLHIDVASPTRAALERVWPGPVSAVLPAPDPALEYLHRGHLSLAVRMPKHEELTKLLKVTGPLVAPSANLAGASPARSVLEAFSHFGEAVFHVDGGLKEASASALVDMQGEQPLVLRAAPGFNVSMLGNNK